VQPAPNRENENESLAALRALHVLDTGPEAGFDALVQVASAVCGVPVSLVSLIDTHRQWFKANVGLPGVNETPRDVAFCAYTVLHDDLFEIPDSTLDPRFADNPLVMGQPDIRFYAGAAITLDSGHRIGTLCVIDRAPRQLSDMQRGVLRQLSVAAAALLQGRLDKRRDNNWTRSIVDREANLRQVVNAVPAMLAYWDRDLTLRFANRSYEIFFGKDHEEAMGIHLREVIGPERFAQDLPYLEAALRGEPQVFERETPGPGGTVRHSLAHYTPDIVNDQVVGLLVQVSDVSRLKETEAALHAEMAERAQVIVQLRASMDALKEAQRIGQIGSWQWDLATNTVHWSEEMYRILGREVHLHQPDETDRQNLYTPESLARVMEAGKLALHTGESYSLELQFVRADGELGWLESTGEVVRDADDANVGLRGTVHAITDRKRTESALRKSQDILERTGVLAGVGGWELDITTSEIVWSSEICRIHGVEPGARPTLQEAKAFYTPASLTVLEAAIAAASVGGPDFDLVLEIVRRDGQPRWVRAVGTVEFVNAQPARLVGAFQDVTQHRRMAAELAEQHELLRITLQSIGDAVITTDAKGHVVWLNPVAEKMTGWLADEARDQPLTQVLHIVNQETRALAANPLALCLGRGQKSGLINNTLLISRDGSEFGIEDSAAPICNAAGEVVGAVLVFHDVSEQRRLSGEISFRATHDALTGLVNRAEFETRLTRALRHAQDEKSVHALLAIDLDQFKLVNDACGHAIGDLLLKQVCKLLGEAIRNRDTLARAGGDEFAIILEHCSPEQAQRVAQKICDRMDDFRFVHGDRRFRIGASIGLVTLDQRWSDTAAVQQAADASCFAAKEAGRNRVHTWFDTDEAMHARQFEMQWTTRIEQALDEDGFVLYAQRITSLQSASAGIHAEVLLRMKNDDGTLSLPGAFLPAAERFHLISRVDRWVLSHAIAWMKTLPTTPRIESINVNLSGQSVGDRAFHAWATAQLLSAGATICGKLCLEITETAAVTNLADAANFIENVRAAGVKVALDDFGAGVSSFGYLKNLPVDYLKIDGQFIRDLLSGSLDDVAVRCFADVARVVGVKTVAEFVEKPAVRERLREIGVDFAQGYLIHRPEPIDCLIERPESVQAVTA